MVITTIREILEIDAKTFLEKDKGLTEESSEESGNSNFVIS